VIQATVSEETSLWLGVTETCSNRPSSVLTISSWNRDRENSPVSIAHTHARMHSCVHAQTHRSTLRHDTYACTMYTWHTGHTHAHKHILPCAHAHTRTCVSTQAHTLLLRTIILKKDKTPGERHSPLLSTKDPST
jgi:hypothetical protein